MHIPPSLWRRLSPSNQQRIIALILSLTMANRIVHYLFFPLLYLARSFHSIWRSDSRTFIASFTTIVSFGLLLIMPLHPLAIPATFGAGLSVSVILHIFK